MTTEKDLLRDILNSGFIPPSIVERDVLPTWKFGNSGINPNDFLEWGVERGYFVKVSDFHVINPVLYRQ